jgi:P4 family phage/plasmid primase-like protien
MLQVLGLRDFPDPKKPGKFLRREVFFGKGWRFTSIADVFDDSIRRAVMDEIPIDERYNLYFTIADCFEESGRKLKEQWAIPFDIDNLELKEGDEHGMAERAARAACDALGVDYTRTGVIFSGNGVQLFVQLASSPIIDENYFDNTRVHYGLLASRIQNKLAEAGIKGEVDTSVWSKARLMRLPDTLNKKPGKPERWARALSSPEPTMFDVREKSGLSHADVPEAVSDVALKNYPPPDTPAVCDGCKFLVSCRENPAGVSEPQWYAMTSITSRLENGRELTHQYSEGHPGYSPYETDNKVDQALASAGPRTCKNIDSLWGKCTTCDYYGEVTSPIMIKSAGFIASKDFGFRERVVDKRTNNVRSGKPVYKDLVLHFEELHPFRVLSDTSEVLTYDGKKWITKEDPFLREWVVKKISPTPNRNEVGEFMHLLKSTNVGSREAMETRAQGYLNFSNGVLEMKSRELLPHNPEFCFTYVLPYPYDATARAPRWKQFLLEVMGGDEELACALEEYGGYCLSGDYPWIQKALMLVGDGANGKSVYLDVLQAAAGQVNVSNVMMRDMHDGAKRYSMLGKLFNVSEESGASAFRHTDVLKSVINGGVLQYKKLYAQPFEATSTAKILLAANEIPPVEDRSDGFFRRLLIVPFNRKFKPGVGGHDFFIKDKLIAELPGICASLVHAYARLSENEGRFTGMEKMLGAVLSYREESDPITSFLSEVVSDQEGSEVPVAEVFSDYKNFCVDRGLQPGSIIGFGRSMSRKGHHSMPRYVDGRSTKIYKDIKLHSKSF